MNLRVYITALRAELQTAESRGTLGAADDAAAYPLVTSYILTCGLAKLFVLRAVCSRLQTSRDLWATRTRSSESQVVVRADGV
jgi:hypothetical protein